MPPKISKEEYQRRREAKKAEKEETIAAAAAAGAVADTSSSTASDSTGRATRSARSRASSSAQSPPPTTRTEDTHAGEGENLFARAEAYLTTGNQSKSKSKSTSKSKADESDMATSTGNAGSDMETENSTSTSTSDNRKVAASPSSTANADSKFAAVTTQLQELESRYTELRAVHATLQHTSSSTQEALVGAQVEISSQKEQLVALQTELNQRSNVVQHTHDDLRDRQRRTADDADRLRDELRDRTSELATCQVTARDALVAQSKAESLVLPLQIELASMQREKENQENVLETLKAELMDRAEESSRQRVTSSNLRLQMESSLAAKEEEVNGLAARLHSVTASEQSQQERCRALQTELAQLTHSKVSSDRELHADVDDKNKTIALLREHLDKSKEHIDFLETIAKESAQEHVSAISELRLQLKSEQEVAIRDMSAELDSVRAELASASSAAAVEVRTSTATPDMEVMHSSGAYGDNNATAPSLNSSSQSFGSAADMGSLFNVAGIGSMSDAMARIAAAERTVVQEKAKRRETEQYLQRVLQELEATAPKREAQRKDFRRVLEQNDLLSKKCDHSAVYTTQLESDLRLQEQVVNDLRMEVQVLQSGGDDLRAQLNHLLNKERTRTGTETGAVATVELDVPASGLLYDDVAQLQSKNEQLVRVVRKLELDRQAIVDTMAEQGLTPDGKLLNGNLQTLHTALQELQGLKSARERTEEMVVGLVQQRDMYRTMLRESGAGAVDLDMAALGAVPVGSPSSSSVSAKQNNAIAVVNTAALQEAQSKVKELQAELKQSQNDREHIQERLEHANEKEKSLREALDTASGSAGGLRLDVARMTGEARFEKERADRLEESLKTAQVDAESALQRRLQVDQRVVELLSSLRAKEEECRNQAEKLRESTLSAGKSEAQLTASKKSQERLEQQINALREDTKSQSLLAESMRRIEAGLSQRLAEEKETVVLERDALLRTVEDLRKQATERSLSSDQRGRALEDEVRGLRARIEALSTEADKLRETVLREEGRVLASTQRADLLDKQLVAATGKLDAIQSLQTMDAVLSRENELQKNQIEQLEEEKSRLTQDLIDAKESAEVYSKMNTSTQTALTELQTRTSATSARHTTDIEAARTAHRATQQELTDLRSQHMSFMREVELMRDQVQLSKREKDDSLRVFDLELTELRQKVASASMHEMKWKAELTAAQVAARTERGNYEREQELHSATAAERRKLEKELEDAYARASAAGSSVSTDSNTEAQSLSANTNNESMENAQIIAGYEQRLGELQNENTRLAEDMRRLADRSSHLEEATKAATQAGSSSNDADMEKALTITEAAKLRRSSAVLLEEVRYRETEEKLLRSRLTAAEKEADRTELKLRTLQQSLDELRAAERQREQEDLRELGLDSAGDEANSNTFATVSASPQSHILSPSSSASYPSTPHSGRKNQSHNTAVEALAHAHATISSLEAQLKVAMDSNRYVQAENEQLSKTVKALQVEVHELREQGKPLQSEMRTVIAQKEALEAEKTQLAEDVVFWREKYSQFFNAKGKFTDSEYLSLQEKFDSMSAEMETLRSTAQSQASQVEVLESQLTEAKQQEQALQTQLDVQRHGLAAQLETDTSVLRIRLSETESKAAQSMKDILALQADLTTRQAELEAQRTLYQNAEKTSEKRYEMLKTMKAQYVKAKADWASERNKVEQAAAAAGVANLVSSASSSSNAPVQTKALQKQASAASVATNAAPMVVAAVTEPAPAPAVPVVVPVIATDMDIPTPSETPAPPPAQLAPAEVAHVAPFPLVAPVVVTVPPAIADELATAAAVLPVPVKVPAQTKAQTRREQANLRKAAAAAAREKVTAAESTGSDAVASSASTPASIPAVVAAPASRKRGAAQIEKAEETTVQEPEVEPVRKQQAQVQEQTQAQDPAQEKDKEMTGVTQAEVQAEVQANTEHEQEQVAVEVPATATVTATTATTAAEEVMAVESNVNAPVTVREIAEELEPDPLMAAEQEQTREEEREQEQKPAQEQEQTVVIPAAVESEMTTVPDSESVPVKAPGLEAVGDVEAEPGMELVVETPVLATATAAATYPAPTPTPTPTPAPISAPEMEADAATTIVTETDEERLRRMRAEMLSMKRKREAASATKAAAADRAAAVATAATASVTESDTSMQVSKSIRDTTTTTTTVAPATIASTEEGDDEGHAKRTKPTEVPTSSATSVASSPSADANAKAADFPFISHVPSSSSSSSSSSSPSSLAAVVQSAPLSKQVPHSLNPFALPFTTSPPGSAIVKQPSNAPSPSSAPSPGPLQSLLSTGNKTANVFGGVGGVMGVKTPFMFGSTAAPSKMASAATSTLASGDTASASSMLPRGLSMFKSNSKGTLFTSEENRASETGEGSPRSLTFSFLAPSSSSSATPVNTIAPAAPTGLSLLSSPRSGSSNGTVSGSAFEALGSSAFPSFDNANATASEAEAEMKMKAARAMRFAAKEKAKPNAEAEIEAEADGDMQSRPLNDAGEEE